MYEISYISSYFLSLSEPESGEGISNLKLQKLCYYAQGFYLAKNEKPLFNDSIEAWQHGPVIPNLYHQYKSAGSNPIPPTKINLESYPKDISDFLSEVYDVYGQFSAWKLRDMTHTESPWIEACKTEEKTISIDSMKTYFKSLLKSS